MISQFHVLSPRGDCIITRNFRRDCPSGTAEQFFRKVKFWEGGAPPIFSMDGVHYISVCKSQILFVFTTRASISPVWAVDLLNQLVKSFRDFCGILSEESLRRNFILIYELIDEIFDSGYPQTTASEQLKLSIHSDAVALNTTSSTTLADAMWMIPQFRTVSSPSPPTIPSSANQRPIGLVASPSASDTSGFVVGGITLPSSIKLPGLSPDPGLAVKNEIFVDIMERVSVIVNAITGGIVKASIDGAIQMKSYLSGNPGLRISLNDDLIVRGEEFGGASTISSSSVLDDVLFHESADVSEFSSSRIVSLIPPDGEFVLMNYRVSSFERLPFRIIPTIEGVSSERVEVQIVIRADIPEQNYGSNIILSLPVPASEVRSVSTDAVGLPPGTGEYIPSDNCIQWNINKLQGGREVVCRARINSLSQLSKESLGPISLSFEIPMYSVSNMQVRYLRISETGPTPHRWVRYVTQSLSYVVRF